MWPVARQFCPVVIAIIKPLMPQSRNRESQGRFERIEGEVGAVETLPRAQKQWDPRAEGTRRQLRPLFVIQPRNHSNSWTAAALLAAHRAKAGAHLQASGCPGSKKYFRFRDSQLPISPFLPQHNSSVNLCPRATLAVCLTSSCV